VEKIRKALIALFPGTGRNPQDGAGAAAVSGENRGGCPALGREDLGVWRQREARRVESLLPYDGEFRTARIDDAAESHALFTAFEAEGFGCRGLTLQNDEGAALDAVRPLLRRRRGGSQNEDSGLIGVLAYESD